MKHQNLNLPVSFFLLLLGLSFLALQTSCKKAPPTISIVEARSLPLGSKVKVTGTVTVASGTFESSNPKGFAIQDSTAGIYIVDSANIFKLHEIIEVIGKVDTTNGFLLLSQTQSNRLAGSQEIQPQAFATGAVDKKVEGLLISTQGIIKRTSSDLPYGYKVFVDDGTGELDIYVNTSTGLLGDSTKWNPGDTLSAIGFASQYLSEHECEPRMASDLDLKPMVVQEAEAEEGEQE